MHRVLGWRLEGFNNDYSSNIIEVKWLERGWNTYMCLKAAGEIKRRGIGLLCVVK